MERATPQSSQPLSSSPLSTLKSLLKLSKNSWGNHSNYAYYYISFRLFSAVSQDDIPQVRKVAAIALNEMIKLIPKSPEGELLNIFARFFKDDQDSVRMQGIDSCVVFAKHLPVAVRLTHSLTHCCNNLNFLYRKWTHSFFPMWRSSQRTRAGESDTWSQTELWISPKALALTRQRINYCPTMWASCLILSLRCELLRCPALQSSAAFLMDKVSSQRSSLA